MGLGLHPPPQAGKRLKPGERVGAAKDCEGDEGGDG